MAPTLRRSARVLPTLGLFWLAACTTEPGKSAPGGGGSADTAPAEDSGTATGPWTPALFCPGDPSGVCDSAEGSLWAGAAKVDITPTCFEDWIDLDADGEWDYSEEEYRDCGCDRLCPDDPGYPGADEGEGDGEFQAVWLAGFHNARPAMGVHDPLWARALVLEQGDTRVAIVALDLVGWFNGEVVQTREQLVSAGIDIDHLIVHATHNHEGPDTMGLWGKRESTSGVNPDYNAWVREQTVAAVAAAVGELEEVGAMRLGHVDLRDRPEGLSSYLRDGRDPQVIDPVMTALQLSDTSGETIAVVAHFGNHPESIADENVLITSDFPDQLRETVESGVTWPDGTHRDGVGGTAIFLNGTVGGMMTSLRVTVQTPDGRSLRDYDFERNDALGAMFGERALDAPEAGTVDTAPQLRLANAPFELPVDNYGFQAMFLTGVLDRETVGWDDSQPIDPETNLPKVETELTWLQLGELQLMTAPGEVLPELAVGGYDGSLTGSPDNPVFSPDNPNPPDLRQAPAAPYWKDHLPEGHRIVLGLGNDQLGYILPTYNFQLDEVQPWFEEAEGDHYEETNSLGPRTAGGIEQTLLAIMDWRAAEG